MKCCNGTKSFIVVDVASMAPTLPRPALDGAYHQIALSRPAPQAVAAAAGDEPGQAGDAPPYTVDVVSWAQCARAPTFWA